MELSEDNSESINISQQDNSSSQKFKTETESREKSESESGEEDMQSAERFTKQPSFCNLLAQEEIQNLQ
jgi:hypothetical protein